MMHSLLTTSCLGQDHALAFIRIGIGLLYIVHGSLKLFHGPAEWLWLGNQMKNLGITWWPLLWGLAATLAEFGGGILLTLGLYTRIAAFFMACTMVVAVIYHIANKDPWSSVSFPLSMLIVFIGFICAGS